MVQIVDVSVGANGQVLVGNVAGKSIKVLAFWWSLPASHSVGFRWSGHEGNGQIYFYTQTGASETFNGGLNLTKESKFIGPVGSYLEAYFSGAGTVHVTVAYEYI